MRDMARSTCLASLFASTTSDPFGLQKVPNLLPARTVATSAGDLLPPRAVHLARVVFPVVLGACRDGARRRLRARDVAVEEPPAVAPPALLPLLLGAEAARAVVLAALAGRPRVAGVGAVARAERH